MPRKRDNPLGLPERVYHKHGAFYYVHFDGRWERLGTDINEAKLRGNLYNEPGTRYGTIEWFLDAFLVDFKRQVALGLRAPRTLEDYTTDAVPLKAYFGRMLPSAVEPKHIASYLDMGVDMSRAVRANRERSCLSACFSWMIRKGEGGIKINPCRGVRRNKETPREVYIEHEDFVEVHALATPMVRGLMDLIYRTLQRPEDIITWTPANIVKKREPDGSMRRVIRNDQGKTGKIVDIAITPEIEAILQSLAPAGFKLGPGKTFIRTRHGEPYSYDGLSAMLRRYIGKTERNKARVRAGLPPAGWGYYDLKGKGATDMWLAGTPLEQIQVLCGHESITTTEIYVKCRWRSTVQPNRTEIHKKA